VAAAEDRAATAGKELARVQLEGSANKEMQRAANEKVDAANKNVVAAEGRAADAGTELARIQLEAATEKASSEAANQKVEAANKEAVASLEAALGAERMLRESAAGARDAASAARDTLSKELAAAVAGEGDPAVVSPYAVLLAALVIAVVAVVVGGGMKGKVTAAEAVAACAEAEAVKAGKGREEAVKGMEGARGKLVEAVKRAEGYTMHPTPEKMKTLNINFNQEHQLKSKTLRGRRGMPCTLKPDPDNRNQNLGNTKPDTTNINLSHAHQFHPGI
jgi:hypothetical protein